MNQEKIGKIIKKQLTYVFSNEKHCIMLLTDPKASLEFL